MSQGGGNIACHHYNVSSPLYHSLLLLQSVRPDLLYAACTNDPVDVMMDATHYPQALTPRSRSGSPPAATATAAVVASSFYPFPSASIGHPHGQPGPSASSSSSSFSSTSPPASSAEASARLGRTQFAKAEDWAVHRDTICHLYKRRGLSLPALRQLMRERYQFQATEKDSERMYKARFKKWGIRKNASKRQGLGADGRGLQQDRSVAAVDPASTLAAPDPAAPAPAAAAPAAAPAPESAGRAEALSDHATCYPSPAASTTQVEVAGREGVRSGNHSKSNGDSDSDSNTSTSTSISSTLSCRRSPPNTPGTSYSLLFGLDSPSVLRLTDEMLHAMRRFVGSATERGQWSPSATAVVVDGDMAESFDIVSLGTALVRKGRTRTAFRYLRRFLDSYQGFLRAPSPLLFIYTYVAVMDFAALEHGLFRSCTRHLADLCAVLLHPQHPLSCLLRQLLDLGPAGVLHWSPHLLEAYVDMCQGGRDGIFMADATSLVLHCLAAKGFMPVPQAAASLHSILLAFEPYKAFNEPIYFQLINTLASIYQKQADRLPLARQLVNDTLATPRLVALPEEMSCLLYRSFRIAMAEGDHARVISDGNALLAWNRSHWGTKDVRTTMFLQVYTGWLSDVGVVADPDLLHDEAESRLDELCGMTHDLGIDLS